MIRQRPTNLNPTGLEAIRITYPGYQSRRRDWKIEAMRFIPHDGVARVERPE